MVLVSMLVVVGMAALVVDLGPVLTARTELQSAADAAALAGAGTLLNEDRLKGNSQLLAVLTAARNATATYAGYNEVLGLSPAVPLNSENDRSGDIVLGHLADPTDRSTPLDTSAPVRFNAVQVCVRRDDTENGSIAYAFAKLLGFTSVGVRARATAMFQDGVVGYEVRRPGQTANLMPLALHETPWLNLINGGANASNDNYTYDAQTRQVSAGPDGLPEINIFPGSGNGQLPPGNFGTVDIGSQSNSTADISRQIREGVNADDLSYFPDGFRLGPDGTLTLNGDTGLSAAIKDDLQSILGEPRAIPLFDHVSGPGNNAWFRVVGFAGVRVMYVKLTGPMKDKKVIVQPAFVSDETAVADSGDSSYYVYRPITLCR